MCTCTVPIEAVKRVIVDCHRTTDSRISFPRARLARASEIQRARAQVTTSKVEEGPRGRVPVFSITPSCPSTILSVIPRAIPSRAILRTARARTHTHTPHDQTEVRSSADFFHRGPAGRGDGTGGRGGSEREETRGTDRYLSIPSERLVTRERYVWYPSARLRHGIAPRRSR